MRKIFISHAEPIKMVTNPSKLVLFNAYITHSGIVTQQAAMLPHSSLKIWLGPCASRWIGDGKWPLGVNV